MSSTNRSGELRVADDFYETPGWAVRALLPELGKPPAHVIEPACGNGAIIRELRNAWGEFPSILGVEIDAERAAKATQDQCPLAIHNYDFLIASSAWEHRWGLAITNPPFVLAQEFAEQCLRVARETALLLRLAFMAGIERSAFLKGNPCDVFVLPRRPQFVAVIKCLEDGCGARFTLPIDAPRPKRCPTCEGKRAVVTSDSADYAWFVWGPGRGNRWKILEIDT